MADKLREMRVDERDWGTLPAPGMYTVIVEQEQDGRVVMHWCQLYATTPKEADHAR